MLSFLYYLTALTYPLALCAAHICFAVGYKRAASKHPSLPALARVNWYGVIVDLIILFYYLLDRYLADVWRFNNDAYYLFHTAMQWFLCGAEVVLAVIAFRLIMKLADSAKTPPPVITGAVGGDMDSPYPR